MGRDILILSATAALVLGAAAGYYFGFDHGFEKAVRENIISFEECAAAGYPVAESYPRQCRVPDGKTFVEKVDGNRESQGAIRGSILLGPTCPVVRDPPDPECADKPVKGEFIVTDVADTREIARFSTDAEGRFLIFLGSGEYRIKPVMTWGLPGVQTHPVEVSAGEIAEYTITFDTGIR